MKISESYLQSLQRKPSYAQYQSHNWADFIELLCLANVDNEISKADVLDRLAEREADLEEGDYDDILEIDQLDDEAIGLPSQRYRKHEVWTDRIRTWFEVISGRQNTYGANYPFKYENDELTLNYDADNNSHKYYLFLLACSKLHLFTNQVSQFLSSYYEILSYAALKQVLPNSFMVELFGTNPLNEHKEFGSGVTCLNKIKNLAKILRENPHYNLKEEVYPPTNFGDAGLDLIAYSDTGDLLPSMLVVFGQCACTEDWVNKQSTSDYKTWSNIITLTTDTINAVFIPFSYRDGAGGWFDQTKIRSSFLIDRYRLIYYLNNQHKFSEEVEEALNDLLRLKEGII